MPTVDRARLPFAEQIAFFRGKLGNLIPTATWTDVWKSQHDRGFMVAGAQKADLLADLAGAVDRSIAEGKSIDWFRKQFDQTVADHGWAYTGERNWRTRTIYRTNMATSYNAGRLAQLRDPELQQLAPLWMYKHNDSVTNPRPLHLSWDGITLPPDHPWWQAHFTPNGWGCMCRVVAVTAGQARRQGGRLSGPPDDGLQPDGTPNGIDKGWDYMPGDTTTDDVRRLVEQKAQTLPSLIAASLLAEMATIPTAPAAPE